MATLTRLDPFHEFSRLQSDLNRWFDSRGATGNDEAVGWAPKTDIYEDAEGVTFKFELPEVDAKDVDVRLEDGVLTVQGERRLERADRKESYHRVERSYGSFSRSFTLPMTTLDFDKVRAESKNGVLRVFVPKRAEAKPRSIQVKVNE